eukprot:5718566-Prymnesium_polylepis.2
MFATKKLTQIILELMKEARDTVNQLGLTEEDTRRHMETFATLLKALPRNPNDRDDSDAREAMVSHGVKKARSAFCRA